MAVSAAEWGEEDVSRDTVDRRTPLETVGEYKVGHSDPTVAAATESAEVKTTAMVHLIASPMVWPFTGPEG